MNIDKCQTYIEKLNNKYVLVSVMDADLQLEIIKGLITLTVGCVILTLGWFVGNRLTYEMNVRQKRREMELNQANKLFHLYGEYYAIWKLYNYYWSPNFDTDHHNELMKRVMDTETEVEATLISIASSRKLSQDEIEILGCFRQSCKFFRKAIFEKMPILISSPNDPTYLCFKNLSCKVGNMLLKESKDTKTEDAIKSFREIADPKWRKQIPKYLD